MVVVGVQDLLGAPHPFPPEACMGGVFPCLSRERGSSLPGPLTLPTLWPRPKPPASSRPGQRPPGGVAWLGVAGADREVLAAPRERGVAAAATTQTAGTGRGGAEERGIQAPV